MDQNFLGLDLQGQTGLYPYTNVRRSSSLLPKRKGSSDIDDSLLEDSYSFAWPSRLDGLGDDIDDGAKSEYEPLLSNSAEREPFEKRGFDSISRWNGGVSGLSQNFIGPKRGDYNSFRRMLGQNIDRMFGTSKRDSTTKIKKRNFDSISNGLAHGFHQNHLAKKDDGDSFHYWLPGGFQDTFNFKGGLRNADAQSDVLDDDDDDFEYSPLHQSKRYFDSIDQGALSGIHQNHLGKRQFDSISTGSTFSNIGQNFINKRSFDSINTGSKLANLYQNYLSKRDFETYPASSKRFDSISMSGLHGMGQNFVEKRFPESRLDSEVEDPSENSFKPLPFEWLGRANEHFVYRRSVPPSERKNPHQRNKRHFDSIVHSGFGGMHQNFVSKRFSDYASRLKNVLNKFPSKKSFDSVGFNSMGGMNQNFISKRFLDSIGRGRIGGLNQNFIDKRNFDSINDASSFGGLRQNFVSRKRFDSIGQSRFSGMGQNFVSKRYFDSIGNNQLGGMRQNFISKRNFDSVNNFSPIGGFKQNFVSKRTFDSINNLGPQGMSQNFISKRLAELSNKTPTKQLSGTPIETADLIAKSTTLGDSQGTTDTTHNDVSETDMVHDDREPIDPDTTPVDGNQHGAQQANRNDSDDIEISKESQDR